MNKTKYILLCAAAMLAACKNEPVPTYTVGADDNTIVLAAGIADSGSDIEQAPMRAPRRAGIDDTDHTGHLPFTEGTQAALRIDGTWTGHDPVNVTKTTTGTIGAETEADSKHNTVTLSPSLYWDDYGTADPANASTGRTTGLTIYGAAVNGETTAPTVSDFTALEWTVAANQTSGWSTRDLLISNNVKSGTSDGCYLFSERTSPGKLLKFTHAMSQITVVMTAGDGFADGKFVGEPTATLHGFPTSGTVNITDGSLSNAGIVTDVTTHCETSPATGQASVTRTAIVFPTRTFDGTEEILTVSADGNTFKVTSAKLKAAIDAITGDAGKMQSGKNYVLNVRVNKTTIVVTATIVNWVEVQTDQVEPVISISQDHGESGDAFNKNYDFYRSLTVLTDYDEDATADGINPAATYTYNESTSTGSWDKTLFWPDHQTHYFFRGVYPQGTAVTTEDSKDGVTVANAAYSATTSPSDLAIALPRSTGNCAAHGQDVETNGICATTGTIKMNFEYAMSKIEVRLKSTGIEGEGKVTLDANTTIRIVGGYNKARILLSTGLHDTYTDTNKGDYTLNTTTAATGFTLTTLDAVVPQVISDDVFFEISVKNANDTYDIYRTQANKIRVKSADGTGDLVSEWEHGKHYIYEMDVNKSVIKTSATLTDWVTVTADEDIWF